MKRIGIVKVGTIPQVVSLVVDRFVHRLQRHLEISITGIETRNSAGEIVFSQLEQGKRLCSISASSLLDHLAGITEHLDILFIFLNSSEIDYKSLTSNTNCRILLIPIDLFNEQDEYQYPLGFDSALNEVVNNIEKVKDTAGSLLFKNKRLFLIQIPGSQAGLFLKTAAAALECDYVQEGSTVEMKQITSNLVERYQDRDHYALLLFNEAINEDRLKEQISVALEVDFRSVMIEEAQCIGGKPTVRDRHYALQLAEKMVQWTEYGQLFEIIRLERNDQIKFATLNE